MGKQFLHLHTGCYTLLKMCRIEISSLTFVHNAVYILGPDFNRDSWFNEKFNLGLDFPNVSESYVLCAFYSM